MQEVIELQEGFKEEEIKFDLEKNRYLKAYSLFMEEAYKKQSQIIHNINQSFIENDFTFERFLNLGQEKNTKRFEDVLKTIEKYSKKREFPDEAILEQVTDKIVKLLKDLNRYKDFPKEYLDVERRVLEERDYNENILILEVEREIEKELNAIMELIYYEYKYFVPYEINNFDDSLQELSSVDDLHKLLKNILEIHCAIKGITLDTFFYINDISKENFTYISMVDYFYKQLDELKIDPENLKKIPSFTLKIKLKRDENIKRVLKKNSIEDAISEYKELYRAYF